MQATRCSKPTPAGEASSSCSERSVRLQNTGMRNDPRSHGLWERSAPPAPPIRRLSDHLVADVVVIGAGYTGLSAALHLSETKASVVVLEAAEVGFGCSGRNVGLVNAGLWIMPDALVRELGEVHGVRLLELLSEAPSLVFGLVEKHAISCEVARNGTLHCAVGATGLAELEERARQWKARGAPVHLLDADPCLCGFAARSPRRNDPAVGLRARACKGSGRGRGSNLHLEPGDQRTRGKWHVARADQHRVRPGEVG